ncbi:MAG: DUF58 domain-containing protein [Myxococcota bacterium]
MDRLRDRRSGGDPALKRWRRRLRAPRSLRATRPGWCFIAIIFGVGFAALNTGNNLLYLVFALMLAFLVLSGLLSEASLRGIAVERRLPREVFAGAANAVVLRIHNRQARVPAFAISVEDRLAADDGGSPAGRCFVLRIPPAASVERSYGWTPTRRGDQAFAALRVSTRFPFGLFVKSVELEAEEDVLVYPAIGPVASGLRPTPSRRSDADDQRGRAPVGDTVSGLREFVRGDSTARIQWRRSLATGRLVVGEREGHASGLVEVLFALAPELGPEAVEARIACAASEIVHHLEAGHRVGLHTRSARFTPDRGPAHRRALLTFLARLEPERELAAPTRTREDRA